MNLNELIPIISDHPLGWQFSLAIPAAVLLMFWSRFNHRGLNTKAASYITVVYGLIIIVAWVWWNGMFLMSPEVLGDVEAQIAGVSWYASQGHPLYHSANSPELYSMLYGPYLYMIAGIVEKVFGPSFFSAKLPVQLAVFASLPILFIVLRKFVTTPLAIFGVSLFVVGHLELDDHGMCAMPDAFIVLLVILAAWAVCSTSTAAPFIFGAAMGGASDVKLHAAIYLLPLLFLAHKTGHGITSGIKSVITAVFVVALPFGVLSNISLKNYLWVLGLAAKHGIDPNYYISNTSGFFMICTPLALFVLLIYFQDAFLVKNLFQKNCLFVFLIVMEFVILLIPASKYGSGPHQLLPLVVVVLLLWAILYHEGLRPKGAANLFILSLLSSWLICAFLAGTGRSHELGAYAKIRKPWAKSIQADLAGILSKYGADHIIIMGSGSDEYPIPFYRTKLIFAGMPIGLDPAAMDDFAFSGFSPQTPSAISDYLAKSSSKSLAGVIWLIPKDETPFTLKNWYALVQGGTYTEALPVYSNNFRADFSLYFHRFDTSQFYDLYSQ